MKGNTRALLPYWVERNHYDARERRTRLSRWRWRLRDHRPVDSAGMRHLWHAFVERHDGDKEAAAGELLFLVLEHGLLPERGRW